MAADVTQDVRFGIRMLAKDRRFTIAAVLALGLGIGVNNSVFTIINTVLFKELPFPDPSRLIDLRLTDIRGMGQVSHLTIATGRPRLNRSKDSAPTPAAR